ncbi:hypothetical protein BRE01_63010 [Brevibacillus reuszeri]|uniref:Uncharacterized protein n=1 Tax=Brevibacillus reuszeri TaxID=54915 RepID=A0A0K9YWC8_9BACL|nr:hypothetical protein [Brevibacillus reuszeri]KNB72976.1 hypothetical protein ADS79_14250 [Brevibacillus reuszeri]GED72599.1 hypothetical protein BRE01_63010 [Brevibacillus reuszeri]
MGSNLNVKLSRSIEMIELATKKMHEKRTGKKVKVSSNVVANGTIKLTVQAVDIDTDDELSAIMAAEYMLCEVYINDVLIQYNLPERRLDVDTFTLDWIEARENNGTYTVLGELVIGVNVELYKAFSDVANYQGDVVTFQTTSNEYITLDCVDCDIVWHRAKVA